MASVLSDTLCDSPRTPAADATRGQVFAQQCPSRAVLSHVTSRWGVLVLVALRKGTHRFGDLRRSLEGVSEKMLAQTLQALEADGFVQRTAYPVVPPHVEYALTPLGKDAAAHVHALVDWIETNIGTILSRGGTPPDATVGAASAATGGTDSSPVAAGAAPTTAAATRAAATR